MSFVLFYFGGKLDVVILIDFIVKESTVQPTCSHGRWRVASRKCKTFLSLIWVVFHRMLGWKWLFSWFGICCSATCALYLENQLNLLCLNSIKRLASRKWNIFFYFMYIYIYFMLHFFCFCNGILAVPDVDISLCRRFAVLILTLLPPKSGLDCSFFKMVLAFGQDYFGEQVLFFFSIPTLKSESQPLYGNTVWDRKQRKHKKKQNQTNKNVKKNKNNPKVRNSSIHSAPAAAATA